MKQDYQGKSINELEAILDAAKKGDFSTAGSAKPPKAKAPIAARNVSAHEEEKQTNADLEPVAP